MNKAWWPSQMTETKEADWKSVVTVTQHGGDESREEIYTLIEN